MTDEELAGKLEEHAKHGSHAYPALLYAAAERLYAFSAKCALLGASLAQAEREVDAVATSEPFGYFRALPMGWEDCAETDEGAIALYERPAPVASAAPECSASEVGIQTSEPRAWAHFVKNGNIRIWSSAAKEAVRIAKENGIELTPLYTEPQPDRVAALERELENERMRLAACGTAALGYYDGCADEYRSASLDDVLRLRAEVERLRTLLDSAADDIQDWGSYASEYFRIKHDLAGCVEKYLAAGAMARKEAQS